MKMKSYRLEDNLIEQISALAQEQGVTDSVMVRDLLKSGLHEHELFKTLNINQFHGPGRDLPLVFKKALLEISTLWVMVEELHKKHLPGNEPHTLSDDLKERAMRRANALYFTKSN